MPGGQCLRVRPDALPLPALAGEAEARSEQRLRRHRAQRDDDVRGDPVELGSQPGPAGRLLGGVGALVQPALAARLELEVLDGVRQVKRLRIQARLDQCLAQQLSGGADEGFAFEVLAVAGLLADQQDPGACGSRGATAGIAGNRPPPGAGPTGCLAAPRPLAWPAAAPALRARNRPCGAWGTG